MALMSERDRALFTAAEMALIKSSLPKEIKDLTPSRLKVQMARARQAAEKYRGLARRQQRETKRVSGFGRPTPPSNARTERKATLLGDAAGRFEHRLEQLEHPKKRKTGRPPKPPLRETSGFATQRDALRRRKQRRRAASESALAARVTRQFQKSKMRAIQGHIRASGKRRQGKRDTRR